MFETLLLTICDSAVCKERSVAPAAGSQQLVAAPYVKKRFLLTGKARLRQILGSRAAPGSNIHFVYVITRA